MNKIKSRKLMMKRAVQRSTPNQSVPAPGISIDDVAARLGL
jgi:hypothetical protein